MQRKIELGLIDRIMHGAAKGQGDLAEQQFQIATDEYCNVNRFQKEVANIFFNLPQMAIHSSELKLGEFRTLTLIDIPVLLMRDKQGKVTAMVNICQHRGAQIVPERQGKIAKNVKCPYHGWVYESHGGKLKAVTHKHCFPTLDTSNMGLKQLQCFEFMNFIWVLPNHKNTINTETYFASLSAELNNYQEDLATIYHYHANEHKLNYKLVFDLFLEVYHIKVAHANSIAKIFHENIYFYDQFDHHLRILNPKKRSQKYLERDRASYKLRKICNIEYILFPNVLVLVEPNHIDVLIAQPLAVDRTLIHTYTLTAKMPESDKAKEAMSRSFDLVKAAFSEDMAIGESIQKGLVRPTNEFFNFGLQEQAIKLYHDSVASFL